MCRRGRPTCPREVSSAWSRFPRPLSLLSLLLALPVWLLGYSAYWGVSRRGAWRSALFLSSPLLPATSFLAMVRCTRELYQHLSNKKSQVYGLRNKGPHIYIYSSELNLCPPIVAFSPFIASIVNSIVLNISVSFMFLVAMTGLPISSFDAYTWMLPRSCPFRLEKVSQHSLLTLIVVLLR